MLRPPASTKPMTLTIPIHSATGVPADNVHSTRKVAASMRATVVENHGIQTPGETPFRPVGCLPLPLNTVEDPKCTDEFTKQFPFTPLSSSDPLLLAPDERRDDHVAYDYDLEHAQSPRIALEIVLSSPEQSSYIAGQARCGPEPSSLQKILSDSSPSLDIDGPRRKSKFTSAKIDAEDNDLQKLSLLDKPSSRSVVRRQLKTESASARQTLSSDTVTRTRIVNRARDCRPLSSAQYSPRNSTDAEKFLHNPLWSGEYNLDPCVLSQTLDSKYPVIPPRLSSHSDTGPKVHNVDDHTRGCSHWQCVQPLIGTGRPETVLRSNSRSSPRKFVPASGVKAPLLSRVCESLDWTHGIISYNI